MGLIGRVWVDLKLRFWSLIVFYRDEFKRVQNMEAVEFYDWAGNLFFNKFPLLTSILIAVVTTLIFYSIFEVLLG